MKHYKIALIKGDGIGPEIIDEAVKVLDAIASTADFDFQYEELLMGGCAYDVTGDPLPQETINGSMNSDAVLLSVAKNGTIFHVKNVRSQVFFVFVKS